MKSKRSKRTQIILEWLIRWWGAGAVYFFIGWGTNLGLQESVIDLVFFLGLALGLFTIVVLDPLIYGFLEIERRGEMVSRKYYERTIFQNVYLRLGEIVRSVFLMTLVMLTYSYLNLILIRVLSLNETQVPLQGEPILFGLFYVIYFMIFRGIFRLIFKK